VAAAGPARLTAQETGSASPTGGVNAARWLDAPYVVLVSFDGFADRYLDAHDLPNFGRVLERGVRAQGMIPSFPTKTFPNHYTLVTGLYPGHHGIVANTFMDPATGRTYRISDRAAVEDGGWYRGEPLWMTAERQGMVAASFFWVGSEAEGLRPTHWRRFDGSVPEDARVDQVLEWLAAPAAERPHLITTYFELVDDAGHRYGPDSPDLVPALREADRLVGRLLDGIDRLPYGDRVYLVLVSDHGMDQHPAARTVYMEDAVDLSGLRFGNTGEVVNVYVTGGRARARALRDRLNTGLEGVRFYLREETPARFHYRADPRAGDLVGVPDPHVMVFPTRDRAARDGGGHGWDPEYQGMRALFVAAGPRLKAGATIPAFQNVHVYPFLAELLGLTPAPGIDGDARVLKGALRDGG